MMGEKRLNLTPVIRCLQSTASQGVSASDADPSLSHDVPRSPARRRFLWQSAALCASSAPVTLTSHATSRFTPAVVARRTASGFAFISRARVVWAADVDWLSPQHACRVVNTPTYADVSLPDASLPGLSTPCALSLRVARVNDRLCLEVRHAMVRGAASVDLDDWIDGRATLSLGNLTDIPRFAVLSGLDIEWPPRPRADLLPNLGLRLQSASGFHVAARQMTGQFEVCVIGPITNDDDRLIPGTAPRAAHLTMDAGTAGGGTVRPHVSGSALQCAPFDTSQVRFELVEQPARQVAVAWLASADAPTRLHTSASGWSPEPHITLSADEVSYARVVSDAPTALLVATTNQVALQAENLALTGQCVDCHPLVLAENTQGQALQRAVVWREGALIDADGIGVQLHFLEGSSPPQPDAISKLLDAIPWHRKRISLANVVIEFTRPEDGLWLRASLDGFSLERQVGRFVISLDGSRRVDSVRAPPLLHLRLPAQSFSEQAFYRSPPRVAPVSPASLSNGNDANADQTGGAKRVCNRPAPEPSGDEKVPNALSALRVAGDSVLRFTLREGQARNFELSLAALLDSKRWQFHVAPRAQSEEPKWRALSSVVGDASLENFTDIELPWRIHISPNELARMASSPRRLTSDKTFTPLFYLRPYALPGGGAPTQARTDTSATDLPLRAIASADHGNERWQHFDATQTDASAKPPTDPIRAALDQQDRNELVWLSGRWGQPAIPGTANVDGQHGLYVPQPIQAQRLLLTAFGASLRSDSRWDPPALQLDNGTTLGLHVTAWKHISTLGRPQFDSVLHRGYLLPFGFRISVIVKTTFETEWHTDRGYLVLPVQRYFVRVEDPVKAFPCEVGQPLESLNGCFQPERFEMTLKGDLQIDAPETWDIECLGLDAFWICAPSQSRDKDIRYPFELRIGGDGTGTIPMAFVGNNVIHDPTNLDNVVRAFNEKGAALTTQGARITFAPSLRYGDTRLITYSANLHAVVNRAMVNSALLEAHRQPPFYPVLVDADVELDAIQRVSGQSSPQKTRGTYAQLYRAVGFTGTTASLDSQRRAAAGTQPVNPAEVFLSFVTPVAMSFTGKGQRSGGVATPNMSANALSRSKGLLAGFADAVPAPDTAPAPATHGETSTGANPSGAPAAPPPPGDWASSSSQTLSVANPFAVDAKLLGIIPLREVFKIVGLDDLPKFVDSIEESISAQSDKLAPKLREFGARVSNAAARVHNTLSDNNQASFANTPQGAQLLSAVAALEQAGKQLANSQETVPGLLERTAALTQQVRQIDVALRDIAAHPEALLHLKEIETLKATYLDPISAAVTTVASAIRAELEQACNEAKQQLASVVAVFEDRASAAYAELSDAFANQVVAYAIAHRNDLSAIEASVTGINDALAQLHTLVRCYQNYYVRGFGLPEAITHFKSSGPTQQVYSALSAVRHDVAKLQKTPANARELCKAVVAAALALEDVWNRHKLDAPVAAKACATPFEALGKHLRELVVSGHTGEVTDAMLLAPVNRAHQVLLEMLAALEVMPDAWRREAAYTKARDGIQQAITGLKATMTALGNDLDSLRKALVDPALATLPGTVITTYVDQTADALSAAVKAATGDAMQIERCALAMCEALGNLLDVRFSDASAVSADPYRALSAPTAGQFRQAIIDTDAALRHVAQTAWKSIAVILDAIASKTPDFSPELCALIGKSLKTQTVHIVQHVQSLSDAYHKAAALPGDPDTPSLIALSKKLTDPQDNLLTELQTWGRLLQQLPAQIEARVLEMIRNEVNALLALVVPARIAATLDVEREIGGYDNVFVPHHHGNARLKLNAAVETDLITRSTASRFEGALTNFEINLFDMVTLGVTRLAFSAVDGQFHLEAPQIDGTTINSPLDFLKGLDAWVNGASGPFVLPMLYGIKGGYRMSGSDIQLGPLTILNFTFEAAIALPFDDRAAIFSVAVGSQEMPCLVSVPPYGGGMYFEMQMAGTRLVGLSAAMEYGLVGGFRRGPVSGAGRIVVGVYFAQNAQGALVQGYFYAGGHASILGIVSVSIDLRVSLTYQSAGAVSGVGRFSVSVGVGIFSWTLRYSVEYHTSTREAIQARAQGESAPASEPAPVDNVPLDVKQNWDAYRSAFALQDLPPPGDSHR
ncbi:hypothetical protein [Burkholderia sp. BE17]|uniref:hypothetical protein n=1 Tax=Burkholderia sp. BE17 TaxID=2656644 RepID=UPI00128C4ECE|nr:hypothetical protein [Burkholderia sp. BE17]MPV69136.1 hypothetical protein [Burkholderia sp. BE17]